MRDSMEDLPAALNVAAYDNQTSRNLFRDSAAFARNYASEDLHPAFGDSGIRYDTTFDCFAPEIEEIYDETTLLDSQKAFANALEEFQQGVKPKYQSKIDLRAQHSWTEVMQCANEARSEYEGVGRKGIVKKIDHRLKSFQTAAPAIEAWLKLLPSTSTYGSVVCGGLTIILEVLIDGKLVQEAEADQEAGRYPTPAAPKGDLERLGPNASVHRESPTPDPNTWLFTAAATRGNTIYALQHILGWFERAAGLKYWSALWRGPPYAEKLKKKMKEVEDASQAMEQRGGRKDQSRLQEIWKVTAHTQDQVGELKILAIEARNHLYAVLKDTEVWQEALQSWKETRLAKEARRASGGQGILEQQEESTRARKSLLAHFGPVHDDPLHDMEVVLGYVSSMTLGDQDRIGAVIRHDAVDQWLLNPLFGALLIHANGRRHDPISPASIACALLIHVFSQKLRFPTLYWFCGMHLDGTRRCPLAMLQSLVCQLLCLSCCRCSKDDLLALDTQNFKNLLWLFGRLVRRSSAAGPVVCILDGISYYEGCHQRDTTAQLIGYLADIAQANPPTLLFLVASPTRTTYLSSLPEIQQSMLVTEVPDHVSGPKGGVNSRQIMSSTEKRVRKMSESLGCGKGPR
ncbi:MAG: hypothetical protein Q9207_004658 [Kuettlingeria erythrocarpa]